MVDDANLQDQRKRSLEALERRFVVAKAEILQQQKKSRRESNEQDVKEAQRTSSSSVFSSGVLSNSSATPSSVKSARKGPFSFSGRATTKDVEENDPAYSQLSTDVHENLLITSLELQGRRGRMVDNFLHELLQSGDSAHKYMQGSRGIKFDSWILLDNLVRQHSVSTSSHIRAMQSHSKRSKKHMSMRQHKRCGSFDLPQEFHKFDIFRPMHETWKGYMMQHLKATGKNQLAQCLLNADLHGAIILVAECKVTSYTGVKGIMIRETAETFGIVTTDDKFRVVPKRLSVFVLQVDCWKITLHGDKLTSRNLSMLS